jgi:hypothetical protein
VLVPEGTDWADDEIGWGNHHMGTTRMAADPKQGVVDADGRVHGIGNLRDAAARSSPPAARQPDLHHRGAGDPHGDHIKGGSLG